MKIQINQSNWEDNSTNQNVKKFQIKMHVISNVVYKNCQCDNRDLTRCLLFATIFLYIKNSFVVVIMCSFLQIQVPDIVEFLFSLTPKTYLIWPTLQPVLPVSIHDGDSGTHNTHHATDGPRNVATPVRQKHVADQGALPSLQQPWMHRQTYHIKVDFACLYFLLCTR